MQSVSKIENNFYFSSIIVRLTIMALNGIGRLRNKGCIKCNRFNLLEYMKDFRFIRNGYKLLK